jgi:nucleotide-binding universal stress UspA family protein
MIEKILCPTDLTVNSKESVAYGLSLARENCAQLIVFHSTSFPFLAQYPNYEVGPFQRWDQLVSRFKVDRLLSEAERKVKNFVHAHFQIENNGIAWKVRAGLGKVAEEIVVAALKEEVDVIVLARHKAKALSRFLTRSISAKVSRNAPCPVLSISPAWIIGPSSRFRVPLLREAALFKPTRFP